MAVTMSPPRNASSHIHSLGYDDETGTMVVQFTKGGTYHYPGVDKTTFLDMKYHESPGEFFHRNVRGKVKHIKVDR